MHNRITEGGPPLKINLTSTVPVVCSGNNDCKVQVQLVHDTTEILLTTCSVTFRNESSFHTIEVHAKRDFIDDGSKFVTIKVAVAESSNALDWQNHLAINDLKVRATMHQVYDIKALFYIPMQFISRRKLLLKIHTCSK